MIADLFSDATRRDPYPLYRQIRADTPVLRVPPPFDAWLIFDFDGVKRTLRDHGLFSSRVPAPSNWFVFQDPPSHTKQRALIAKATGYGASAHGNRGGAAVSLAAAMAHAHADARHRRLAMLHRVGRMALGQASVLIAVSTPHRSEAFEACRWLIDTLKAEVAIWKKEIRDDGAGQETASGAGRRPSRNELAEGPPWHADIIDHQSAGE